MLSQSEGFTPLPHERRLFTSSPRASISLQSLNKFPGKEPLSLSSNTGRVHLTNKRIVYLPETSTPALQSFAAPLLNLHDTHVTTPYFGPNAWIALVQTVPGGGIPAQHQAVELKITFKDGGAYDFHNKFVQLKERMQQAVEVARESSQTSSQGVNMDAIHLDQLPAYEESTSTSTLSAPQSQPAPVPRAEESPVTHAAVPSPSDAPPGYDEVQREAVTESLERDMRIRDP